MAEQQLVDYIKKASEAGQSNDQTRTLLSNNGWSQAEVDEAFLAVGNVAQPAARPQPSAQPQQRTTSDTARPQQPQQQPVQQRAQPQPQAQAGYYQATPMEKPQRSGKGFGGLIKLLIALLILAGLGAGGYFAARYVPGLEKLLPVKKEVKNTETPNNSLAKATATPVFAKYDYKASKVTPSIGAYTIGAKDLVNLSNFETAQKIKFSEAQKSALSSNNFFIAKNLDKFYNPNEANEFAGRNDDWTGLYSKIGGSYNVWERQPENSVFISSDFVLHVYHKLIDQEFSYIEETNLYPTLQNLSKSMLSLSTQSYLQTQDPLQRDSYERISAYFLVGSAILENASNDAETLKQQNFLNDTKSDTKEAVLALVDSLANSNSASDNASALAKQEIGLIFDAKNIAPSPIFDNFQDGMPEDYTQYGPRSHYAKNTILRDYFRAMMWYGRINFLLKNTELTRDAANITLLLTPNLQKQWESIYQPTTFFVGKADDLTLYDYANAQKKVGFNLNDENNQAVGKLQTELQTYQNPQIMSSVVIDSNISNTSKEDVQNRTKGFRFMGQRFTPDAFVFSTLTQGDAAPDPKTGQKLPSTPTALMVSTLMGSKESATLLKIWIQTNAADSDKVIADRMQTLQTYFDKTTQAQWTQNIYWSWLYTIKSLFANLKTDGYPMFMKSEDWDKKSLQAFLGSWTELKHDTLLYAKQSYAELGAGGPTEKPAKPVPKGYVEPNVELYDRLSALITMSRDGLKSFGILPENFEQRNNQLLEAVQFYRDIAVSELQNQTISEDNFEKLRLSAGNLDEILQDPDSQVKVEKNARSAIIADVHTDMKKSQILYEADGIPNYIFVAVKDANGTRLTKGLVYSYYEFTGPIAKRLTDQQWQKSNYSANNKNLVMPTWSKDLIK